MLNRRNILYPNSTHLSSKFSIKIQPISAPSMQFIFVKFLLAYWVWKFYPVPVPQGGIPSSERWHSQESSQMGPKKTLLLLLRTPLDDSQRVRPRPRISRRSTAPRKAKKAHACGIHPITALCQKGMQNAVPLASRGPPPSDRSWQVISTFTCYLR